MTVNDIIAALERVLGVRAERQVLPEQPGDIPRTWASIALARAELGYAPTVDLDEGVARFVAWLREDAPCA